MVNPYLTEDNKPSDFLFFTLDYYGISLEKFKVMSDEQVRAMVKRFSDVLNDGRITHDINRIAKHSTNKFGEESGFEPTETVCYGDSGSFSRYFDLDKWFSKQIENLPESVRKTFPFLICPKASKSERNQGLNSLPAKTFDAHNDLARRKAEYDKPIQPRRNVHPTVKPLKLMSYLVTLGSRMGDVVLDPFCGSGTTCLASEILNRKWIGIDINPEYCGIARKRLAIVPEKITSFF